MQNRGPNAEDTRNTVLAIAISAAILIIFQFFVWGPQQRQAAERARVETAQQEAQHSAQPGAGAIVSREEALAQTSNARVNIDHGASGAVDGSILLAGARFDDLRLRRERETVARNSPEVTLLSPNSAQYGFDAVVGWEDRDPNADGVGRNAAWRAAEGAQLSPDTPLVLTLTNADGLQITRTISVDNNYMFTVTDEVRNTSRAARQIRPFGVIRRDGLPPGLLNIGNVHQGFVGAFGENNHLVTVNYKDAQKFATNRDQHKVEAGARLKQENGRGGWVGITDHYWLTAIIPDQSEPTVSWYDATNGAVANVDNATYRAAYEGNWRSVAPGASITYTQHVFAGAKVVETLQDYQKNLHIPRFDEAVDWGNLFWFLTRPFFWLLHHLAIFVGQMGVSEAYRFGVAIILSTVVIRGALFPLVYTSFKSMAKLRTLQPKMKEIQERYAADKQRQQQEMIRLYQTEKINPLSGCLPLLFQMPVFFALYKTLSVTIEMRHAHFVGWILDLSARDPTSLFNLFGLLPFNPGSIPVIGAFLLVGAWPIVYGLSMWASQAFAPPPTDPTQAQVIRMLPLIFTFVFAGLPAGLVIYYSWSNCLTVLQQYVITRRQGQKTQFDEFLEKRFGKQAQSPAE
ncbi:MAG TPA: membrane protein insertase YidC [Caulobacterales bacterium]|nr:membrane protein insertase YidC [Caulobacterales bacterium]